MVLALSELERVDEEGNHLHIWKDASYNNKNRLRDAGAVAAFVRAIHRWAVAPDADPLIIGGLILSLGTLLRLRDGQKASDPHHHSMHSFPQLQHTHTRTQRSSPRTTPPPTPRSASRASTTSSSGSCSSTWTTTRC